MAALTILAIVVAVVLVKLALGDQAWPESRVLVRAIFVLVVAGGIPLAIWLSRGRR